MLHTSVVGDYDPKKQVVFVSWWFLQSGISVTARYLNNYVKENYNVLAFDNAGHWRERKLSFTIENQKKILYELLHKKVGEKDNIHIVAVSLPATYTIHALYELFQTNQKYMKTIKTLTFLAPALNIQWALNGAWSWHKPLVNNPITKFIARNDRTKKHIASKFIQYLLSANVDFEKLSHLWEKFDDITFTRLLSLAQEIPTHLVYNTKDAVVVGAPRNEFWVGTRWGSILLSKESPTSDQKLQQLKNIMHITVADTDRHSVYLQNNHTESTLDPQRNENNTTPIGEIQNKFLLYHDRKLRLQKKLSSLTKYIE